VHVNVADVGISAVRMGQLALLRRELCLVTRDRSGGWRHRYRHGTIVSPHARSGSWRIHVHDTLDVFCHVYRPEPGDTVLEVGAGWGTETVVLSRMVGRRGRVIAVEASPHAARLLRRTVEENALDNVTIVEAAVSDHVGIAAIADVGGAGDIRNTLLAGDGQTHEVHALTLDAVVAEHGVPRIDLLKVNIEGAERLMVRGMQASTPLVRHAAISCHDFLADERADDDFRTRKEVREFLVGAGFAVTTRTDDPRPWVRDYLYASR
jgi:FkbM family methyltransferase